MKSFILILLCSISYLLSVSINHHSSNLLHVLPTVSSSQYLGCYIDDNSRDIAPTFTSVTSVEECQAKCPNSNYFALQAGFACFCGNSYSTKLVYAKVADPECVSSNGKVLGGGWRNAVYRRKDYNGPANVAASQYLGCYIDDSTRDIKNYVGDINDVSDCQSKCSSFNFFSIQYGVQCFCGNTYGTATRYSKVADTECVNMNNGRSLFYGSGWRNAIYKNSMFSVPSSVAAFQYLGCYIDDSTRDIKNYVGDFQSANDCQAKCTTYNFFAVQYGVQCFCGNFYSTATQYSKVADTDCTTMNNGRSLFYGSGWRNAVF